MIYLGLYGGRFFMFYFFREVFLIVIFLFIFDVFYSFLEFFVLRRLIYCLFG